MSPVTGPGAARSVWELSPDPDMVGHMPNSPLSVEAAAHSGGKGHRRRNGPDDDVYGDDTAMGQASGGTSDESKEIFDLVRAG